MKNMKKIIAIAFLVIIVGLCTTFVSSSTFAATEPKLILTPSTIGVAGGEEFSIEIALENNPGISGVAFSVSFDNGLEFKNYTLSSSFTCLAPTVSETSAYFNLSVSGLSEVSNDGALLTLNLKMKCNATGFHGISLTNIRGDSIAGRVNFTANTVSLDPTFNGRRYRVIDQAMTWTDAKTHCESLGGHLTAITNAEEQAFVESLIASNVSYWIGAKETVIGMRGAYEWITGEQWSYANWSPNQPDSTGSENYIGIYANSSKKWNDFSNSQLLRAICEWGISPELTLAQSAAQVKPDSLFDLTVGLKNNEGITGVAFNVNYSASIELVGYSLSSDFEMIAPSFGMTSTYFNLTAAGLDNYIADGEIITLTFRVRKNISTEQSIWLSNITASNVDDYSVLFNPPAAINVSPTSLPQLAIDAPEIAAVGRSFDVTIAIKNNAGLSGVSFYIAYGAELEVLTVTAADGFEIIQPYLYSNPMYLNVAVAGLSDVTGDCSVVTIKFFIKNDAVTASQQISIFNVIASDMSDETVVFAASTPVNIALNYTMQDTTVVRVTVKDGSGCELSSGYTINWYEHATDTMVSSGNSLILLGLDNNAVVYDYEIILGSALAVLYELPKRQSVTINVENYEFEFTLTPISQFTINGTISDDNGIPISDAKIYIRQIINGSEIVTRLTTNASGVFSAKLIIGHTDIAISKDGYITKTLLRVDNGIIDNSCALGNIALSLLPENKIVISLNKQAAAKPGETPAVTSIASSGNFIFTIYNLTTQRTVSATIQDFNIMFDTNAVSAFDEIEITAVDRTGVLGSVIVRVVIDANLKATAEFTFLENGAFTATATSTNTRNTVMVFDANGEFVQAIEFSSTVTSGALSAGNYTLAFLGYTSLLVRTANIESLRSYNLAIAEKNISIFDGVITEVTAVNIPKLDDSKLYYTLDEGTAFTVNKKETTVGVLLTFRSEYAIDEAKYNTSNQTVIITLPHGIVLSGNSVTLDGIVVPFNYSETEGVLTVITNKPKGIIRFNAIVAPNAGNYTLDSRLRFTISGETVTQPIGSLTVKAIGLELYVPEKTGSTSILASGKAFPNANVQIFSNGVLVATVIANKVGDWSVKFDLINPSTFSSHTIYAVSDGGAGGLKVYSEIKTVSYNMTVSEPAVLTMYFNAHNSSKLVIDLLNPYSVTPSYSYAPGTTFTFVLEFTNPIEMSVSDVYLIIEDNKGNIYSIPAIYDQARHGWVCATSIVAVKIGMSYVSDEGFVIDASIIDTIFTAMDMVEFSEEERTRIMAELDSETIEITDGIKIATLTDEIIIQTKTAENYFGQNLEQNGYAALIMSNGVTIYFKETIIDDEYFYLHVIDFEANASYEIISQAKENAQMVALIDAANQSVLDGDFKAGLDFIKKILTFAKESLDVLELYEGKVPEIAKQWVEPILKPVKEFLNVVKWLDMLLELGDAYSNVIECKKMCANECQICHDSEMELWSALGIFTANVVTKKVVSPKLLTGLFASLCTGFIPGVVANAVGIVALEVASKLIDEQVKSMIAHAKTCAVLCTSGNQDLFLSRGNGIFVSINPIIDPSGYVYEGVDSNRIESVTATIYWYGLVQVGEDIDGFPVYEYQTIEWDAEEYSQMNPLYTDSDGRYAWDVPEGKWKVVFTKDGYETVDTRDVYADIYEGGWLPVPPPQLEINIAMTSYAAPTLTGVWAYENGVEFRFSKYMKICAVSGAITVKAGTSIINGTVVALNAENGLATEFRFVFDNEIFADSINFAVSTFAESYAGTKFAANAQNVDVTYEVKNIVAHDVAVQYGTDDGYVTITFYPTKAAAGKTVYAYSSSEDIAEVAEAAIVGADGKVMILVTANLPGVVTINYTLDGTSITGEIILTVTVEAAPQLVDVSEQIIFADATFIYDGTVKSLFAAVIADADGSFIYVDENGDIMDLSRIAVGIYTIIAVYDSAIAYGQKTAILIINKASGENNPLVVENSDQAITAQELARLSQIAGITIEYKLASEADSAYTTTVPTSAGEYVVRVTFAETESYTAYTYTRSYTNSSSDSQPPVDDNDGDKDSLSAGVVIGIVIGSIALLSVAVLCVYLFVIRKRKI